MDRKPFGRSRGRAGGRGPDGSENTPMRRPGESLSYAQMGRGAPQAAAPPPVSAWGPPPGGPSSHQRGPPQQRGPPPEQRGPPQQRGPPPEQRGPPQQRGPPPEQRGPPQQRGPPPEQRGPPSQQQGHPSQRDLSDNMHQLSLGGNGGAAASVGRGGVRGRRPIPTEIVRTRPEALATKKGKGGKPIPLTANYFRLLSHPNWCLYQYRVDVAPEEDRTSERKKLLKQHRAALGGYLFDGTVLFTSSPLTSPQESQRIFTSSNDEDQIYTLKVKLVGDVSRGDLAYIQVFNMLMRMCLAGLNLQLVGRDYFDANAMVPVPEHKLELWPGYKTSIRQHESEILMCVEIAHKVMRKETVLDFLNECYSRFQRDYQREFVNQIVGCVVLTDYNNKTYRIDDVDFNSTPLSTFTHKGSEITYAAYMREKYQITVRDMKQPMLISKARARDVRAGMSQTIYLIPEVCRMTGLTEAMRNNFHLMRALAKHTRVTPGTRIDKLLRFNQRLNANEQTRSDLQRWEMKLESTLVPIPGRILEEEKILLGGKNIAKPGELVDWTKELRNAPMLIPIELETWTVVVFTKLRRDAVEFINILRRAAAGMSFIIHEPHIVEIHDDRSQSVTTVLGQILDNGRPQLIMCIVATNRGDRYCAIKKKCCVDRAVPTQVVLGKNLNSKGVMSIATKVAIQINCKIGGAPWTVEMPLPDLMVVGFDVCHDTSNKALSYGAMVASLDRAMSRYFSAVTAHRDGEELSNQLALNIIKALRKYQDFNRGALPKRIIIYRDGVGEGQIPFVHSHEVKVILEKLSHAYPGDPVKVTFIIVTKRINTRLFAGANNPPPGTVADDVITDPEKYDFFLVSQSVREGTVSPTSYNVIHDTLNLPPERLQRVTYKLCHMYFNWSGTVRVPAPCQYAHKLAFLVGQSLHRPPAAALEDLLYFL